MLGVVVAGADQVLGIEEEVRVLPLVGDLSWNSHGAEVHTVEIFLARSS